VPHTITSQGEFDSGRLDRDGIYRLTFNDFGSYWYECHIHKDMVGLIVVTE
jgi:plastocyanin